MIFLESNSKLIDSTVTVTYGQEVILAAIRDEGSAFEYASLESKSDYDFALEVVSMGGPGGSRVSKGLKLESELFGVLKLCKTLQPLGLLTIVMTKIEQMMSQGHNVQSSMSN